jgi:hypothetical protein
MDMGKRDDGHISKWDYLIADGTLANHAAQQFNQ